MFRGFLCFCLLGSTASGCVSTKAILLDPTATQYEQVDSDQIWICTYEDELAYN